MQFVKRYEFLISHGWHDKGQKYGGKKSERPTFSQSGTEAYLKKKLNLIRKENITLSYCSTLAMLLL